jgi:hypothetical protein
MDDAGPRLIRVDRPQLLVQAPRALGIDPGSFSAPRLGRVVSVTHGMGSKLSAATAGGWEEPLFAHPVPGIGSMRAEGRIVLVRGVVFCPAGRALRVWSVR